MFPAIAPTFAIANGSNIRIRLGCLKAPFRLSPEVCAVGSLLRQRDGLFEWLNRTGHPGWVVSGERDVSKLANPRDSRIRAINSARSTCSPCGIPSSFTATTKKNPGARMRNAAVLKPTRTRKLILRQPLGTGERFSEEVQSHAHGQGSGRAGGRILAY